MIVDYAMNDLEYEKKPEIIAIPYDFTSENEMQDLDSSPRVLRVYQDIADHLWKQKTPVIYIDYTGGMRDISLLMMTVIRHLEWIGVSCKRIVYSNWEDQTIYDIGYIYEMLRLIDSTNNFVATGTARNLRRLFAGLEREETAGWDETNAALESLEKFSDAISLCDISDIGALASDMNLKLRAVIDLPTDVSSIYLRMFKTLIPQIREKMYADRWNNQSEYEVFHPSKKKGKRQTAGAFTYRTKIQALKRLEQESGEQAQQLLGIMQYYLTVKYLRNKMNHASEQTDTEDEAALKEYLSESAHINPEMRTENIQSIIQNGLRISGWKI